MFRQKSPGNVVVLLIFGLLLKTPLFLHSRQIAATQNDAAFYHWLINGLTYFNTNNALLCSVFSFLLLYAQALLINHLVNEYRLLAKPTYLPAMAYLLITSLLPDWNYLSSPLVSATLMIWILSKLFRLYNQTASQGSIFNIGLLLGISSYIYFPSACFMLCILLGLMILKPFRLNEIVLFLMGCFTPYYFIAAYLFLTGTMSFKNFLPHISIRIPELKSTIWMAASTLLLTLPFLIGGYFIQIHLHKMLIQVRKAWSILLLYLLLAFFILFVNSNSSFSNWVLLAAPFAAFHAATYYYPAKKWFPTLLFFLTTGYILYLQYGTRLWL